MSIPKIIYSTWINDKPLPAKFQNYIESWKRFLPDYEIRMITLENVSKNPFTKKFIYEKRYAVAAQYARTQRVYETGGLYFDIDVEVIKSFDMLLGNNMFAGIESRSNNNFINNAVFGTCKGNSFLKDCMTYMDNIDVLRNDIEVGTGPLMFTELMKDRGWISENKNCIVSGIQILSSDYFYPYCPDEQYKPDCITENTHAVHHWAATWKNSVSVIIHGNYLKEELIKTIEVVKKQTVKVIEIILINDRKNTHSLKLQELAELHKIKIIETDNSLSVSAKNAAVDFAKGKWILILKSGDKLEKTFIEKTIDKGDIVGIETEYAVKKENQHLKNDFMLFKKEVWEKISGYDEKLIDGYDSNDFLKRAAVRGYTIKRLKTKV
ncbi:MAG: hypothetical protein HGGPFJEG_02718 [Ignavibacteria bacterium]|nr:hypothetical protein [Ignavibacteria bacterium]